MGIDKEGNIRDNGDEFNKWRKLLPWSIVCAVVLLLIWVLGFPENNDTDFSPNSFYVGDATGVVDPKVLYDNYYKSVLSELSCRSAMFNGDNPIRLSTNMFWIIDDDKRLTDDSSADNAVSLLGDKNAEGFYTPYEAGDYIIAPTNITYLNSNIKSDMPGRTDIVVMCGRQYKLVFEDVECWWCHIGISDSSQHTTIYGKGGKYSTANAGRVLGQAKSSTRVKMYKQNGDSWDEFDFADYLTRTF